MRSLRTRFAASLFHCRQVFHSLPSSLLFWLPGKSLSNSSWCSTIKSNGGTHSSMFASISQPILVPQYSSHGLAKTTSPTVEASSVPASSLWSQPPSTLPGPSSTSCGSTSKSTSTTDGEPLSLATWSSRRSTTSSESFCTQSSSSLATHTSSVLPCNTGTFLEKRDPSRTRQNTRITRRREKPPRRSLMVVNQQLLILKLARNERLMAPISVYKNEWWRRWLPPKN